MTVMNVMKTMKTAVIFLLAAFTACAQAPSTADADAANVKKLYPGADAFTKMLEERSY